MKSFECRDRKHHDCYDSVCECRCHDRVRY